MSRERTQNTGRKDMVVLINISVYKYHYYRAEKNKCRQYLKTNHNYKK